MLRMVPAGLNCCQGFCYDISVVTDGRRNMNFIKVVRMAIRYRWTFLSSIVCALMVAVFWGCNIGAVYPIVEVTFQSESPQKWINRQIAETQKTAAEKTAEIAALKMELPQACPNDNKRSIA